MDSELVLSGDVHYLRTTFVEQKSYKTMREVNPQETPRGRQFEIWKMRPILCSFLSKRLM